MTQKRNDAPQNDTERSQHLQFIAKSKEASELLRAVDRVAVLDAPILISGEVGNGKSLLARLIHEQSGKNGPFLEIDLATITPNMGAAQLFGHMKGSFTGAVQDRKGLLRDADGGTIYLAQVEDAPLEVQAALLRFVDSGVIRPLGSDKEFRANVRLIASTTTDPFALAADGRIRQDLLARLSTIRLHIPPLRERTTDIPPLVEHFLATLRRKYHASDLKLEQQALSQLMNYQYPGNVRQLRSILEGATIFAENQVITTDHLRLPIVPREPPVETRDPSAAEQRALKREIEYLQSISIRAQPIWEGRDFQIQPELCFVLMPFAEENDVQSMYSGHIKKVIEERCNLRCERADDIYDINGVMQSVWESICRARLIIAEMTGRNPNVFYELGIAHTLGKPVIMVTQSMEYVPFDLKHLRCIVYDYKPGKIDLFEDALYKTVTNVLSGSSPRLRQELT